MTKIAAAVQALMVFSCLAPGITAQTSSGTITGTVVDPDQAALVGATVTVSNPVSHYSHAIVTDAEGKFELPNLPFNNYHVTAAAPGFQTKAQDVNVRTPIPIEVKFSLPLGAAATTTVAVTATADLLETNSTTHTDVDRELFDKLPVENQTSSLSSAVTMASPGISADSNGLFHGMGDHASNSFSVDGQQITDQQSKVFSNQIPLDSVQSMEVIEGAPPAEYGDKTSLVIVVNTRSGLGVSPPHGSVTASYGSFGSSNETFELSNGNNKWGNFISLSGMDTGRFLDGPEFAVMHDHGNEENAFDRIDFKPDTPDSFTLNLGFTRSWFQTPNSFDAQSADAWSGLGVANGGLGPNGLPVGSQDQRSQIRTFNIAPSFTHLFGAHTAFTVGGNVRQDQYYYYPSDNPFADYTPDLQLETTGQHRTLTNLAVRGSVSYVAGIHNFKAGFNASDTILTEKDAFGVVDPNVNAVCLNADGSPDTNPLLTNPANCVGGLTPNPSFIPLLGCYDLTRLAPLPSTDGCPTSTSALYNYYGHANIRELALYVEDTITKGPWSFSLGLRGDIYDGITKASQAEPRLGVAYTIKPSATVLRISYARTLETPFNENLVLSSEGCSNPAVNALISTTTAPCVSTVPLTAGWRNEFHAGLEQAFGKYFVLDGEYVWKYTHEAYDFSVLGNTPITFPIEWSRSKIPGFAARGSMPTLHGLSAYIVLSHVAARFFEPQVSGIGATPTGSEVFRIDHDEIFNQTTHLQYQPFKTGPWIGFDWRYDSGQVAGEAPCAGGNCVNGPLGTDSVVDVSYLTPDQQYEAGLVCGSVHATITTPISPNGLCPATEYGSTLLHIPAPGTENDDHTPPRVDPRNLFDLSIGHDNLFHGDKRKWSARLVVTNLTNKVALYNFLSTFSGTHYVEPRAITATLGFHF
ncbi:MAG TPA: TonB-dependent receptor [Bryobacteraceae bacterium]|nr:TonB-dependent receptor [Bryobacteraceae bacterium]